MKVDNQPWLPKIEKVRAVEKKRKLPQPQIRRFKTIKRFELLHRPFDIRFRGRLNKWITRLIENGLDLKKVLDPKQLRVVRFYLFPQKSQRVWLTQKQVLEKVKINGRLRDYLIDILLTIWKKKSK